MRNYEALRKDIPFREKARETAINLHSLGFVLAEFCTNESTYALEGNICTLKSYNTRMQCDFYPTKREKNKKNDSLEKLKSSEAFRYISALEKPFNARRFDLPTFTEISFNSHMDEPTRQRLEMYSKDHPMVKEDVRTYFYFSDHGELGKLSKYPYTLDSRAAFFDTNGPYKYVETDITSTDFEKIDETFASIKKTLRRN